MAKECLENCPAIKAIERNLEENRELDVLAKFFNNGLNSALRASDDCQGPLEKEDERRNGWRKMVPAGPLKACGWNASIQNETILAPE